jgi:hypothetical protein
MSKPTSSSGTAHKPGVQPRRLKVYKYGDLTFALHQGDLPPRNFDIKWDKVSPASGPESPQEPNAGCNAG